MSSEAGDSQGSAEGRVALQRLRDRTDELELIISGLTTYALFTLPGWLIDRFADQYAHLSVSLLISATILMVMVPGLCYALGLCFLLHLLTRSYWIGLVGLRTVFPEGIDWSRTPGIGPLMRGHYQSHLPNLASAIARADRLASTLFAVISLIAIGMLWLGSLMLLTMVGAGHIGARFGAPNAWIGVASLVLVGLSCGVPVLIWLLDSVLARRIAGLREQRLYGGLVLSLGRAAGVLYPQRLILPLQLTLQSNTRPWLFLFGLAIGVAAILVLGSFHANHAREFSAYGDYRYLGHADVATGVRSSHYEDMRSQKDRFRLVPMLPSMQQNGAYMSLFIPYYPVRDNVLLDRLCIAPSEPLDCLRQIWSVELADRELSLTEALPTERLDLGLRGLSTWIPLTGLRPGVHRLVVTWNPLASDDDLPIDDRFQAASMRYQIPFLFNPTYEQGLDFELEDTSTDAQAADAEPMEAQDEAANKPAQMGSQDGVPDGE